jgi:hypothetical protein
MINTVAFHFFDPPCGAVSSAPMEKRKARGGPSFVFLIIK